MPQYSLVYFNVDAKQTLWYIFVIQTKYRYFNLNIESLYTGSFLYLELNILVNLIITKEDKTQYWPQRKT